MSKRATANVQAVASTRGQRQPKAGQSKRDQLIRLLSTQRGAVADTISRKFGWQAHTTRAALSRLRKAGFDVRTEKSGDGKSTRYRIVAAQKEGVAEDAA